jgi:hypothetical protein
MKPPKEFRGYERCFIVPEGCQLVILRCDGIEQLLGKEQLNKMEEYFSKGSESDYGNLVSLISTMFVIFIYYFHFTNNFKGSKTLYLKKESKLVSFILKVCN